VQADRPAVAAQGQQASSTPFRARPPTGAYPRERAPDGPSSRRGGREYDDDHAREREYVGRNDRDYDEREYREYRDRDRPRDGNRPTGYDDYEEPPRGRGYDEPSRRSGSRGNYRDDPRGGRGDDRERDEYEDPRDYYDVSASRAGVGSALGVIGCFWPQRDSRRRGEDSVDRDRRRTPQSRDDYDRYLEGEPKELTL
jgi:hypothetical protein